MDSEQVERRVEALEQALARQRIASTVLALGLVLSVGAGAVVGLEAQDRVSALEAARAAPTPAAASSDLSVTHLTLVDAQGAPRAALGIDPQGVASFSLMAPDGSARLRLHGGAAESQVSALDDRGVVRGGLGWSSGESGTDQVGLVLRDREGAPREELHVAEGGPRLTLTNEVGVPLFAVP